jgi:hypothetical protein
MSAPFVARVDAAVRHRARQLLSLVDRMVGRRRPSRLITVMLDAANRECMALAKLYGHEGHGALAFAPMTGDPATDEAALWAALRALDARWDGVWNAWHALRAVEVPTANPTFSLTLEERVLALAYRAFHDAPDRATLAHAVALGARRGGAPIPSDRFVDIEPELDRIRQALERALRARLRAVAPGDGSPSRPPVRR